mmetsp:Transcript_129023/g.181975  ORF Transcript_129023/g.181975 Transcript_129023/m.181975 type:complete len:118 (+) Transcript_129023:65-418(+)
MARRSTIRAVACALLLAAVTFSGSETFIPSRQAQLAVPLATAAAMQNVAPALADYNVPTPEIAATAATKSGGILQYGQVLYQQDDGSQSDVWLNLFCIGLLAGLIQLVTIGLKKDSP